MTDALGNTHTYQADAVGNLTADTYPNREKDTYIYLVTGEVAAFTECYGVESRHYTYNDSNQIVTEELFDGKKTTTVTYTYDADGNLVSEAGWDGREKVELTYTYTVENRLEAVYDGRHLLMAAAYDGDGNRVFQLNYNPYLDADVKDTHGGGADGWHGNKNRNNRGENLTAYEAAETEAYCDYENRCVLFPIHDEVSNTEEYLIHLIGNRGRAEDYELIEYINDVNREYAEVLVEQNINGKTDTTYVYGAVVGTGYDRLSIDKYDCRTGYYLYDGRGSVTGITNEWGFICRAYTYNANGEIIFGEARYENEYAYNGESYNPNIESQYLRARYYNVVTATFITEDFYPQDMWSLWNITEPLTLNRYNYCVSSPLNYVDPSGHTALDILMQYVGDIDKSRSIDTWRPDEYAGAAKRTSDVYQSLAPYLPMGGVNAVLWGDPTIPAEPTPPVEDSMQDAEEKGNQSYCVDINGEQPEIINGWLRLYGAPTVTGEGRSVLRHSDANKYDWGMPEDVNDINKYAREQIETNGGVVEINAYKEENANIFTDAEGRYWVAVGPRVINPNADLTEQLVATDFAYGTKMDIHVRDDEGNEYYIPVVLGDIKAHSAPDGLYQTGVLIPSNENATGHGDGSTVEFMGNDILKDIVDGREKSCVNRTNNYELLDIIVYDDILNY